LLAIACLALFLMFAKVEDWLPTALTAFAVMFSASVVVSGATAPKPAWTFPVRQHIPEAGEGKPSVLHIVLDEMATPAIATNAPRPDHPASTILDDLSARGFKVNDRADSISHNTNRSVSAIAGMTTSQDNFNKLRNGQFSFEVKQNDLLAKFSDAGYQVRALQYGYLDICRGNPRFDCATYTRGFEMNVFAEMNLDAATRLKLALLALHKNFTEENDRGQILLYHAVAEFFGPLQDYRFFSTPAVVLKYMDRLANEAATMESGVFSFNHLLLPHFPFVLSADCGLKPVGYWTFPASRDRRHGSDKIYAGYWDQVACVRTRLLDIIDKASTNGNLWIVVHGDHGSRISRKTDYETPEDLHRTFLAIRGPGVVAGRNPEPVRLHDELLEFYTQFLARAQ
jgi:hypothetical protein